MAGAAQVKRWFGFGACAFVVGACSFAAFLQMAVPGQEPEPVIVASRATATANGVEAHAEAEPILVATPVLSAAAPAAPPAAAADGPAAPATGGAKPAAASVASSAPMAPLAESAEKKQATAKSKRAKTHKSRVAQRRRAFAFLPRMRRLERFPMRVFLARRYF